MTELLINKQTLQKKVKIPSKHKFKIRRIKSKYEILSVLKKSEDYVEKIDGVKPSLKLAEEIMTGLPSGFNKRNKVVYALCYGGKIAGFADILYGHPNESSLHIGLLIFKKEFRNRGLGTIFISKISKIGLRKKYQVLRAGIVKTNEAVKHFWEKQGFISTQSISNL